tara:strand:- start:1878 stop:2786 length:909 start_codon:yes stop_codon:yes gene_type:complete
MIKFKSPVYPVSPSFDENEKLELLSTIKYLNYITKEEGKIVMTTAGTSQYNLLTIDEVRSLNLCVINNFKEEKILGLPALSLKHVKEEIEFLNTICKSEDKNKISLLILFPERYYDDEQIVEYFSEICELSNFEVLVHGNVLKKGMGGTYEYSKPLLEKLSNIDGFIGMKEEAGNMMHSTNNIPKGKLEVIVAGGSMRRFWSLEPHGATTYLVGVGSFYPKWEELFYDNYLKNNITKCTEIIQNIETPLFEVFMSSGWHLSMRTSLKHLGFIKNDRKPFKQPTKEVESNIKNILNTIKSYEK